MYCSVVIVCYSAVVVYDIVPPLRSSTYFFVALHGLLIPAVLLLGACISRVALVEDNTAGGGGSLPPVHVAFVMCGTTSFGFVLGSVFVDTLRRQLPPLSAKYTQARETKFKNSLVYKVCRQVKPYW